jgi:hypothetical protein
VSPVCSAPFSAYILLTNLPEIFKCGLNLIIITTKSHISHTASEITANPTTIGVVI